MARPKNKDELLKLSKTNYDELLSLIVSFSSDDLNKEFPVNYLNRNVRDVIAHLHHWHLLFLNWYELGMNGQKPHMPSKGYTWKTTPDLNKEIREMYEKMDLHEALDKFSISFGKVRNIIIMHSNEELFEKKRHKWTGSTSLGAYLISATSSHYEWANKLIKKCLLK